MTKHLFGDFTADGIIQNSHNQPCQTLGTDGWLVNGQLIFVQWAWQLAHDPVGCDFGVIFANDIKYLQEIIRQFTTAI